VASPEGFLDLIWKREIGADSRELAREALRLIDQTEGDQRAKLLAAFFWANWARGQADARKCKREFWELSA
jgi:hypothetical protein